MEFKMQDSILFYCHTTQVVRDLLRCACALNQQDTAKDIEQIYEEFRCKSLYI